MYLLQILREQWFGAQYVILDLKRLSDLEDFISSGTIFHNFARRFIIDSLPKKTVRQFLVGRWTPFLSS